MKKLVLLIVFGAGYVLGAKAGRSRYEEIKSTAQKVAEDPRVRSAAETAKDKAAEAATAAKQKVESETTFPMAP